MNYNKSYFKEYDNYTNRLKNECINDFIDEKRKSDNFSNNSNNSNNLILFQDKIEELLLKLKFLNSSTNILTNINNSTNDLINNSTNDLINNSTNDLINSNKIIDILDISNIILKSKINELNMIDAIDDIIIKLNKKIISQGQIKRKNNFVEFEF